MKGILRRNFRNKFVFSYFSDELFYDNLKKSKVKISSCTNVKTEETFTLSYDYNFGTTSTIEGFWCECTIIENKLLCKILNWLFGE